MTMERRTISPLVNINESDKEIILEAEMSGLRKEDISLDLKGDELTIKGASKRCELPEGYTAVYRERCPLEYSRTFILGDEAKKEGITARYESGLLTVVIPKAQKPTPRNIDISD